MTVIRVHCPECGLVDLRPAEVTLTITDPGDRCSYAFVCPGCGSRVQKAACAHTVTLLVHAGAPTVVVMVPAEALEPHLGPVLTVDDLLDLHIELAAL